MDSPMASWVEQEVPLVATGQNHRAEVPRSRAMRADAMESVTCGRLSLVVSVGFVAQGLTGAW